MLNLKRAPWTPSLFSPPHRAAMADQEQQRQQAEPVMAPAAGVPGQGRREGESQHTVEPMENAPLQVGVAAEHTPEAPHGGRRRAAVVSTARRLCRRPRLPTAPAAAARQGDGAEGSRDCQGGADYAHPDQHQGDGVRRAREVTQRGRPAQSWAARRQQPGAAGQVGGWAGLGGGLPWVGGAGCCNCEAGRSTQGAGVSRQFESCHSSRHALYPGCLPLRCRLWAERLPAWAITQCHKSCQAYIMNGGSLTALVEELRASVHRTTGTRLPGAAAVAGASKDVGRAPGMALEGGASGDQ